MKLVCFEIFLTIITTDMILGRISWISKSTGVKGYGNWFHIYSYEVRESLQAWVSKGNMEYPDIVHTYNEKEISEKEGNLIIEKQNQKQH